MNIMTLHSGSPVTADYGEIYQRCMSLHFALTGTISVSNSPFPFLFIPEPLNLDRSFNILDNILRGSMIIWAEKL